MLLLLALLARPAPALEVTVYNQDLALIQDSRSFDLKKGVSEVSYPGVAARADAASARLACGDGVSVLSQEFDDDLSSPDQLLDRYVGREIELVRFAGAGGAKRETLSGTLLSHDNGLVLRSGGRLYVNPPGTPALPPLPGLATTPALRWKLSSASAGRPRCEVSYLTSGLSWQADYAAVLDASGDRLDLDARAAVADGAGADYRDAALRLVAGSVHRARAARPFPRPGIMMMAKAAPGVSQAPFSEYHLYSLARPVTLRRGRTTEIELAQAFGVPVRRRYVYEGATARPQGFSPDTRSAADFGTASQSGVDVSLTFKNDAASGLGLPLPAGTVRVYQKDASGEARLAGEDSIGHTAKDEEARLTLGRAFDLVGERVRTDFSSDAARKRVTESFRITLRNHKDRPATVEVVEPMYRWSRWKITRASRDWKKKDAQTIVFSVPVPADGQSAVDYTVRYSW